MTAGGGEYWLHSFGSNASFYMPMKSLYESLFAFHTGAGGRVFLSVVFAAVTYFLVFAAATAMAGPAGGILAALLSISTHTDEPLYNIAVLLVAVIIMLRSEKQTTQRGILLGLAIGASLLYRSVLMLLPPLIAIYDMTDAAPGDKSVLRAKRGLIVMGVSYCALLPWIYFNWIHAGRFLPFEGGGGADNMVSAALGAVSTPEGNIMDAAGIAAGTNKRAWALLYMARHPLTYAAGLVSRLWFVCNLHPALYAIAVCGMVFMRKNRMYIALALVAAYFTLIYSAFSVEPRYLEPVLPMLAIMAAWPFSFLAQHRRDKHLHVLLCSSVIFLAGLCVMEIYTDAVILKYKGTLNPQNAQDIRAAISAAPGDAWLYTLAAQEQINRRDYVSAAKNADTAIKLSGGIYPQENEMTAILDTLALAQGDYERFNPVEKQNTMPWLFARALHGNTSFARDLENVYAGFKINNYSGLRHASGTMELALDAKLKQLDTHYSDEIMRNLLALPDSTQAKIISAANSYCHPGYPDSTPACDEFYKTLRRQEYLPQLALLACENKQLRPLLNYEFRQMENPYYTAQIIQGGQTSPHSTELSALAGELVSQAELEDSYYYSAVNLELREDYSGAVANLENLLKENPYYMPAYEELAAIYPRQGQKAQMEQVYKAALRRNPKLSRETLERNAEDVIKQNIYIAKIVKAEGNEKSVQRKIAEYSVAVLSGKIPDANTKALEQLLAGGRIRGYKNSCTLLLLRLVDGDYQTAQTMLLPDKNDPYGMSSPGGLYRLLLQLPQQKVSMLLPRLGRISINLDRNDLEAYKTLSAMHDELGLKSEPGFADLPELTVAVLSGSNAGKQYREKLHLVLSSKHIGGQDAPLLRALLSLDEGDYYGAKVALDEYKKTTGRNLAQNPPGIIGSVLEQLPFEKMKFVASRLHFVSLDENSVLYGRFPLYPAQTLSLTDAGISDAQKKNFQKAETELLRAIELNPHYLPAYSTLGVVYMNTHRTDKLLPLYRQAAARGGELWGSPLMDMLKADYAALSAIDARKAAKIK